MDAVDRKGHRLLKIRNPWGTDEWRGAWSDGSEQWTAEWIQELNHKFGDDGVFWISYEDFLEKYLVIHRTRLFDKNWDISQQWTSIDVSWSADYNDTKFSLTLQKKSAVVIVLSQLDNRYFRGFEGQYDFRLHFRLDKDGEEDYIVRSHGSYFMKRSVSTDLELEPGTYSVLMRITARRSPSLSIPEDTIKENCKTRPNKLVQVGLSYDLAFAKGEIKETEEEKNSRCKIEQVRKQASRKKQRDAISTDQRKDWERGKRAKARHLRHKQKWEAYQRKKAEKSKAKNDEEQWTTDNEQSEGAQETPEGSEETAANNTKQGEVNAEQAQNEDVEGSAQQASKSDEEADAASVADIGADADS